MSHDAARVLDAALAIVCLAIAGAIIISAVNKAEPLVLAAARLFKDATS